MSLLSFVIDGPDYML